MCSEYERLLNACEVLKATYESDNYDEGQKEFALNNDIEFLINELNKVSND